MLDAEALLLVDHHQSEILETHVTGKQAVRADNDVHRACGQPGDSLIRFPIRLETRQHCQADRETGIALGEGLEMLLHQ